jgi:hypothetical protein
MDMKTLYLVVVLGLLASVPAWAYVDPGSGSMIIQTVIAVFAGGSAFLALFLRRIFKKRKVDEDDATTSQPPKT